MLKSVDLNQVVDSLKIALNNYQAEQEPKIIHHGLVTMKTNDSMMYIILKKIIENGLKFNKSCQPTVSLHAKSYEDQVEISITDNGIGIDPAYQEQIFEMFKRLHDRKTFKSSGIGLAIVKLLMDKLGSTVEIQSQLHAGSTFVLRLPNET